LAVILRKIIPVQLQIKALSACLLTVLAFFCVGGVNADFDTWMPYPPGVGGPWGGSVRQIVSDDPLTGLNLWAATNGGIYYSSDSGVNWTPRNEGLDSYKMKGVAVCRVDSQPDHNVLLASTERDGLFTSADGGLNWEPLEFVWNLGYCSSDHRDGVVLKEFKVVAIDPENCSVFYVGTDELMNNQPDDNDEHLLVSRDSGASWEKILNFRRGTTAKIADDANRSLIVGTREGDVYKFESVYNDITSDYDSTLTVLNAPMEFGYSAALGRPYSINDLDLPGADGSVIAVVTGLGGLFVLPSGGGAGSWVHVYKSPSQTNMNAVAADPLDANRLVFYGFNSLTGFNTDLFEVADLTATLAAPDPKASEHRRTIATPEVQMDIQDIYITGSSFLLAEDMSGIFSWNDAFGVFVHSSRGLSAYTPVGFDFHPDGSGQTQGDCNMGATGGLKSNNGSAGLNLWDAFTFGGRWVRIPPSGGLQAGGGRLLRYTKDAGAVSLWTSVEGYGLYHGDENGSLWTATLDDSPAYDYIYTMVRFPDTSHLLVGTSTSAYYSLDGGTSWPNRAGSPMSGADILLPDATDPKPTVEWQVARDIRTPLGAYASSYSQYSYICTTPDAGVTWSRVDEGAFTSEATMRICSLAASEKVEGHLYAGLYSYGLFESTDGGKLWLPAGTGTNGLPIGNVKLVDIGPWEDDILAAAHVYPDGIYLTGDGGENWYQINTGLEMGGGAHLPKITALGFTADGTALIIGGEGIGLQYLETGSPPVPDVALTTPVNIFAGSDFDLALVYTDPDLRVTPTVTVVPSSLPPGASFDGTTLSWSGAEQVEGTYELEMKASEGVGGVYTVTDTLSITVSSSPLFSLNDMVATVGQELIFTVSVAGPPFVVTAAPLPTDDATFENEGTAGSPVYVFRWMPNLVDTDSDVTFSATDGVAVDSVTITIAINEPPLLAPIADIEAAVGTTLGIDFALYATDPNSDPLTYDLSNRPAGASFDPDTGDFSWTPDSSQGNGAVYNMTLRVSDGRGGNAQRSVTITVTGGTKPPSSGGGGGGGGCFIQSVLIQ
jgi:photosystem II stability/assembly factor-like uncharacterized protein